MITSTKNSVSPQFKKRQKVISDTDGDQIDDKLLRQEEENTNGFSFKQSNQTPVMNIQTFEAHCAERQLLRLISTNKEYE
jgi:hypothetical protein